VKKKGLSDIHKAYAKKRSGNEATKRWRLYLSASIANAPLNKKLRQHLPPGRFELILPQDFAPRDVDHPSYPRAIYERCIEEMERCDAGIILLDAFGVDSASEAGWFAAKKKPLIGIAVANCRFLRHWMVKGNLTSVICMDEVLFKVVKKDPVLRHASSLLCNSWEGLAESISFLLTSSM